MNPDPIRDLRDLAERGVGFDMNPTMMFTTAESMYSQWLDYFTRLDREWRVRVSAAIDALSTPPADDVREALTAARNVERYIDMLALDADDRVHVVIDDGYDGDGVIQSLEVPDLRTLIAFVREVRPHGTVTDAERQAVADAIDNAAVITPRNEFLGGSTIANLREVADAALEAAREVHP